MDNNNHKKNNQFNFNDFLSPENVFPHYPIDYEQQHADLYLVYSKLYNQSTDKVTVLNNLMNIQDGLRNQQEIMSVNIEEVFKFIKEDLARSTVSREKQENFLNYLNDYISVYCFGEYNLEVYNELVSMYKEHLYSSKLIVNDAQLKLIAGIFKDLLIDVDTASRISDHISLLDVIIQDIIISGYKGEIPDKMTSKQKERAKVHRKFKPQKAIKYELYEQFLNEDGTDRIEAHNKLLQWFDANELSLEEYAVNKDPEAFYNAYWKKKNREYNKRKST